jgi:hypothetical protein
LACGGSGRTGPTASDSLEPTRLVAGPLIFRVSRIPPDIDGTLRLVRYVVVVKLNQDPYASGYTGSGRGEVLLRDDESRIRHRQRFFRLGGPRRPAPGTNCFGATFSAYLSGRPLPPDRITQGGVVPMTLRFLTPDASANTGRRLGRPLARAPRLLHADYLLRTPVARRELQRIGCRKAAAQRGAVVRMLCAGTIETSRRGACHYRRKR